MVTRTNAVAHLLHRIVLGLGDAEWLVVGGNRLRAKFTREVEGIILLTASGRGEFWASFEVGPRFPAVEKIVNKAARTASMPNGYSSTAAIFPTVTQRMDRISNLPDRVSLRCEQNIVDAIHLSAIPFINSVRSIDAATEYATSNPGPFGHHSMRLPVLQALCGRKDDAMEYLQSLTVPNMPNSDFFLRYSDALRHLI